MDYIKSEWEGFERLDFEFKGRKAILIVPNKPTKEKKWLFKTEYFGAFPSFELEMLKRGYYVAHIQNKTRWCLPEDTDIKAEFCELLSAKFGLNEKCMPVGMSCGGMQAVYFAAKYPQYVKAMYLDAPVLNLLSCPGDVGKANGGMYEEFHNATGMDYSFLINYRNHPIDNVDALIRARIPIFLICGDSDTVVPYCENGMHLANAYKKAGADLTEILKEGCDHHPHGLEDNTPLIEFALSNY
ncbi:MAG: alpha/beta fold hydrolase [Clostridia bacterium]|nr:alpha/beta fold hydrolase [Clostridia bacterium]